MTKEKQIEKTYQRAPYTKFTETREALGWTASRLAQELGYSSGGANGWEENGMPMVAFLACDALLAKHKKEAPTTLLVLEFHGSKLIRSKAVAPGMTMEVNGKKHWLVEQ